MDRITLRKLTKKSTLNFGRFKNLTVEEFILLKQRKAINYLRWAYFNQSKISFTDNILIDTLKIAEEDLIPKPGINKDEKLKKKYYPDNDKIKKMSIDSGVLSKGIVHRKEKSLNKKSKLQRLNHGK